MNTGAVADTADRHRSIWKQRLDRLDTYLEHLNQRSRTMPVSGVANSESFKVTTPSDREIRLTRVFDAPRKLVFEAMVKPEHVARWWGNIGEGYTVPVCEIDLRLGGAWRFVNRTPKGELAGFHGVYREITPPERLVFTEIFDPFPDVESVVTTVLTEEKGKTRFTMTAVYPSVEVRDMVLKSGMEKGAAVSYDRLEEVAAALGAEA
jgi:uncharacterized protein YndB with AHSA1/START domain